jgi:hypothetical protein
MLKETQAIKQIHKKPSPVPTSGYPFFILSRTTQPNTNGSNELNTQRDSNGVAKKHLWRLIKLYGHTKALSNRMGKIRKGVDKRNEGNKKKGNPKSGNQTKRDICQEKPSQHQQSQATAIPSNPTS